VQAAAFSSLGQHVCGEVYVGASGSITLYPILRGSRLHDPYNNGSHTREVLPYVAYAGEAVCAQLNFSRIDISYATFYGREAAAAAASNQAAMEAAGWSGSGGGRCCRVNDTRVLAALDLDSLDICNCTNESSLAPFLVYPQAVVLHLHGSALASRQPSSAIHNAQQVNVWDLGALLADWDRNTYGRHVTLCNYTVWNFSQVERRVLYVCVCVRVCVCVCVCAYIHNATSRGYLRL
jgi:hypothetical protein